MFFGFLTGRLFYTGGEKSLTIQKAYLTEWEVFCSERNVKI